MMDVEFDAAAKKFTKDRRAEQKRDIARKSREAAEKAKARAQQALWEREAEMRPWLGAAPGRDMMVVGENC